MTRRPPLLAAELAALRVDWQEIDSEKVLEEAPDRVKAQEVIRLFKQLTQQEPGAVL